MSQARIARTPLLVFLLLLMAFALSAQPATERMIYVKVFNGSNPAYQKIAVEPSGAAVYTDAEDGADPIAFQLPPKAVADMFALAKDLDYFRKTLESGLKIANMGEKTFRYEGKETHSQSFNYSTEPAAQKLLEFFEKIAESQRLFIKLEYSLKFDRLGINDTLVLVHAALQRDRLLGTNHFLPLLDQVVNGKRYMNISRNRADAIARSLRKVEGQGAQPF